MIRLIGHFLFTAGFFFFFFSCFIPSYAQEKNNSGAGDIQQGFEEAIANIESRRLKEQEQVVSGLREKLDSSIRIRLALLERKREGELNKAVQQQWERLFEFGPYIHWDYFLRDFSYEYSTGDIIKTESLLVPYKAYFKIIEKLYVEKAGSPDISKKEKLYYVFTDTIKVSLEYRDNKFVEINTEYAEPSFKQGWPEEIIRSFKLQY